MLRPDARRARTAATGSTRTCAARRRSRRSIPRATAAFPRPRRPARPPRRAPGAGTPAWLQQAYDLTYLSQTGGTTATVAIVDAYDNPTAESDLATYRARYGLPACTTANGCFKKLNQSGAASPLPAYNKGWAGEIALDVDAVSALCPNCKIVLVEANSSYSNDLGRRRSRRRSTPAPSTSPTATAPPSPRSTRTSTARFPGVALVASTGDNGTYGSGVASYPAAIPGIIAAGGTSLALSGGSTPVARGFGESAWSGAGSGCDTHNGISKPSYQSDPLCPGRAFADVSAVADPYTGLTIYDTNSGGWVVYGGTSLSSPLIAAYLAVTGVDGTTPKWAYDNSALLNDPVVGLQRRLHDRLHLQRDDGLRRPDGRGLDLRRAGHRRAGRGRPVEVRGLHADRRAARPRRWPAASTRTASPRATSSSTARRRPTAARRRRPRIGSGKAPVLTNTTLSGLTASTTYHYRLVATNSAGTAYGYDYTLHDRVRGLEPAVEHGRAGDHRLRRSRARR